MSLLAGFLQAETPLIEGNAKSPVRILIFEDLGCSDCATLRKMLDEQLLPKYKTRAAFEHRDFPLPKHIWARKAAAAARYFQTLSAETAVAWRRYALSNIDPINAGDFEETLKAFAIKHKADPQRALAALSDVKLAEAVEKDVQEGVVRGVSKTPTVFVNGEPFVETFTIEEISKAIDAALAEYKQ
jgi:protein-disulfide isomerase